MRRNGLYQIESDDNYSYTASPEKPERELTIDAINSFLQRLDSRKLSIAYAFLSALSR